MDISTSATKQIASVSGETLVAALAKKQQVADGEAALKLLDSASIATPAASSLNTIDIKV